MRLPHRLCASNMTSCSANNAGTFTCTVRPYGQADITSSNIFRLSVWTFWVWCFTGPVGERESEERRKREKGVEREKKGVERERRVWREREGWRDRRRDRGISPKVYWCLHQHKCLVCTSLSPFLPDPSDIVYKYCSPLQLRPLYGHTHL